MDVHSNAQSEGTRRRDGSVPPFFVSASVAAGAAIGPSLCEPSRRYQKPLDKSWQDFLSPWNWQWFATFTFKEEVHPEAAGKRFGYFIKKLDEANGWRARKKSSWRRRCVWARGLEYQKRDVLHFHALIGNLPWELNCVRERMEWGERWFQMGNTGIARVLTVSEVGGVCGYISKYCSKGGDVDVSDNLPRVGSQFAGV